jgi:protein SERAC1
VLQWGYDSSVAQLSEFSSKNSIFSHAENFLLDLARSRRQRQRKKDSQRTHSGLGDDGKAEEIRNRPIIFVGHSLGGLLVKQALIRSTEYYSNRQDMDLGAISQATVGVLFIGTPHRGSSKASLGKIAQTAAMIALRQPNMNLLDTLKQDSQILESQRKSFDGISSRWTLVCLYEEHPMSIGEVCYHLLAEIYASRSLTLNYYQVVPMPSACMDGFNVKTAGIPKNHREMCRFTDPSEIGYQRTSDYIISLVESSKFAGLT